MYIHTQVVVMVMIMGSKYRVCIRPEISRTRTIGKKGVSIGTYFTQHLQYISLNTIPVDFARKNLTYLEQACAMVTVCI